MVLLRDMASGYGEDGWVGVALGVFGDLFQLYQLNDSLIALFLRGNGYQLWLWKHTKMGAKIRRVEHLQRISREVSNQWMMPGRATLLAAQANPGGASQGKKKINALCQCAGIWSHPSSRS